MSAHTPTIRAELEIAARNGAPDQNWRALLAYVERTDEPHWIDIIDPDRTMTADQAMTAMAGELRRVVERAMDAVEAGRADQDRVNALRALWNWLAPLAGVGPIVPKRKAEAA